MKQTKASRPSAMSRNRLKFLRLAEKRVNKVAKQLQLIGNLSNRTNYSYDETEVEKIFSYIEACVQSSRERFQSSDNGPTGAFSLTKD
tara:strand:- start:353 stop:616 length:264 start_codon:yes stop_codon:yes gene_type:complete